MTKTTRSFTKPSSRDVARMAGVSQSTVSRAFNENYTMEESLRNKVLQAAKALDYRPNAIARSLLSQKINIVGIVVPDIKDPFISCALNHLVIGLQQAGLQSLLFVPEQTDNIDTVIDKVLIYQMRILIVFTSRSTTRLAEECNKRGITAILFNRYIPGSNTSAICCNDLASGRKVAQELYECGYRRFCFVSADSNASTIHDRKLGFMLQLYEYGIHDFITIDAGLSYEDGLRAGEEICKYDPPIDACFCSADTTALGVVDYLKHVAKKNIPEDIGIIGFDDIPMTQAYAYRLTTVRQPWSKLIDATLATVKEYSNDPETTPVMKLIEGELIVRDTTKKHTTPPPEE